MSGIVAFAPDPAAEFAAAVSLRDAAEAAAKENGNNLSETYQGGDEFMRQCMRIGRVDDVWPYRLEDRFGAAALEVIGSECHLKRLGTEPAHWAAVAVKLALPVRP